LEAAAGPGGFWWNCSLVQAGGSYQLLGRAVASDRLVEATVRLVEDTARLAEAAARPRSWKL